MRARFILLILALTASACASSPKVKDVGYQGSRCPPSSACAPGPSPLRQYFDATQRKYYYYDPVTYRYYWENGSPKS